MDMKLFYKTYRLGRDHFAELAGVGRRTLIKYENGYPVRRDAKGRIEKAVEVVEKNNLRCPRYTDPGYSSNGRFRRYEHMAALHRYDELFKRLLDRGS